MALPIAALAGAAIKKGGAWAITGARTWRASRGASGGGSWFRTNAGRVRDPSNRITDIRNGNNVVGSGGAKGKLKGLGMMAGGGLLSAGGSAALIGMKVAGWTAMAGAAGGAALAEGISGAFSPGLMGGALGIGLALAGVASQGGAAQSQYGAQSAGANGRNLRAG